MNQQGRPRAVRYLGYIGSVVGVVAVAGLMVVGSQFIRQARLTAADVVASPSPSPIAQTCISADQCASSAPTSCVPGEGTLCSSTPAPPSLAPLPSPTSESAPPNTQAPAGTTVPTGQIQASFTTFSTGEKLGITVAILYASNWVSGATVTVSCSGTSWSEQVSGVTASSATWPQPANGPRPPTSPEFFFWAQLPGPGSGTHYACQGTATFNGLSTTFSIPSATA